MVALFGGIIVILSAYSLSWEFTTESFLWLILGILLCIPNFIHLVVVEKIYGGKRK